MSNQPGRVVLLARDDAAVRTLAAALLIEERGYVGQACVAEDALWVAGTHEEIDLLLADVETSAELIGIELALRIVEECPTVRILVMSGSHKGPSHLPA